LSLGFAASNVSSLNPHRPFAGSNGTDAIISTGDKGKGCANAAGSGGDDHRSTVERPASGKAYRIASLTEIYQPG
jgi:hypothetical protein